jgi:hypothetical protein
MRKAIAHGLGEASAFGLNANVGGAAILPSILPRT